MKWRITGAWTNHDAAAHRCVLIIKGFDHRGAVLPTDTVHRVPAQLWLETEAGEALWGLSAGMTCPLAHTFEMDEVCEVVPSPYSASYMELSFRIDLADDPSEPASPG